MNIQKLIVKGFSRWLQNLITKGFAQQVRTPVAENQSIVKKGFGYFQKLITKGYSGVQAPVPPTPILHRRGGTVVGIASKLNVAISGIKEFEESLEYKCIAEIHKEVNEECIVFGSKQFENQLSKILRGNKEYLVTALTSIIAKTKHLNDQVLKIQGKKVFQYNETKVLKANKIFNSNLENRINASRQFNSGLINLVKASRIQNSNLVAATKGKRDLFPILFAAVDMYNEIFTDEIGV